MISEHGAYADAVAPDVPIPMIATRDVAAVAAQALATRDRTGTVVRELLGPRDLSYAEATAILGARLALPDLAYVRLPDDEMVAALRRAGFSVTAAALHVELGRALSNGTVVSRHGRMPDTTTPTRFEDYVKERNAVIRAGDLPFGALGTARAVADAQLRNLDGARVPTLRLCVNCASPPPGRAPPSASGSSCSCSRSPPAAVGARPGY